MAVHTEAFSELQIFVDESPLKGSRFLAAGPVITQVPTGRKSIPRLVTEPAPEWVDPNEAITPTEPTYDVAILELKGLKCLVPVTNDALKYSEGLDPVLTSDVIKAMGAKLDLAYLQGSAGGPSGILKAENELVSTTAWAGDARLLLDAVIGAGVDPASGVFFASPGTITASTPDAELTPAVLQSTSIGLGAASFPVIPVPALTAAPVLAFVVMDAVVVGNGRSDVDMSTKGSGYESDVSSMRVVLGTDIKRRHKWAAAWCTVAY